VYFIYSFLMGTAALLLLPYWTDQGLASWGSTFPNLREGLVCPFGAIDTLAGGAGLVRSGFMGIRG